MQEYEDDFFFEEDKILPKDTKTTYKFSSSNCYQNNPENLNNTTSNLTLSIIVDSNDEKNNKKVSELSDATKKPEMENKNEAMENKDEVLSVEIQELAPDCIVNDLRQERYQLMYQNLILCKWLARLG